MKDLPIHDALPALREAIAARAMAVVQAPPGAGKTTVVPLDLLASGLIAGRIVMLQPHRLAARAAAERMAQTYGEDLGQTIGYRIRGEAKVSAQTRIEVVTEGILTRMIQTDPDLPGVGAVIFDEFHERSLNADLGLALVLDLRAALRPDLVVIVMSATLDAGPVAALMGDAPLVTSQGRMFAVQTRWLSRPLDSGARFDLALAGLVVQAAEETTEGTILVFLPGEGEIRRVEQLLASRLGPPFSIWPLYGAMDFAAQRAALAPAAGRKVVLATSIAETSLTLPDVRVVVDGGKARRARFDPSSGMSRLVTERVTKAEAEQRRGRAGRVAEGICYRLWTKGEEGGLPPFPPAEIEAGDLTGLALDLSLWGSADLPFLTEPPAGPMAAAQEILARLGAVAGGRITPHGRQLAALPLHPRLAHMLALAGPKAAPLAALMAERDPLRGAPADMMLRLAALADPSRFAAKHPYDMSQSALERIRAEAKRLQRAVPQGQLGPELTPAQMAALAYPDRIGLRRKGDEPRWLLSGGKGAVLAPGQELSGAEMIVAVDLDGDRQEAGVRLGFAITLAQLRQVSADQIGWSALCEWSRREGRVLARRRERLGALVLDDQPWPDAPAQDMALAALEGLRQIGPSLSPAARRLQARIELVRGKGADWPDCSDAGLLSGDVSWILPALAKARTQSDLRALDLTDALLGRLTWAQRQDLDRLAPPHFTTPLGRLVPIDYEGENPEITLRLQEMFGVTRHPCVGPQQRPLRVTLLSPGQKPLQVTMDIPGFWATSYADVRKDMRGQYPRHPWPEDPTQAEPTLRAKPRGT